MCVFALLEKMPLLDSHFPLTYCGGAEVVIEMEIVDEDAFMLMRILFGCH